MTLLILFAFVAGAGTAASPCVLPVLPAVLSASATGGRRRPLGVVLGLATTFTVTIVGLGALVGGVGLGDGTLRTAAAIVLLGFGIALVVPRLAALVEAPLSRLARLGPSGAGHGFGSGLAVGAALGFAYAPCAGPILAAVITVGAASGRVVPIAIAYSAGSAAVLLVFALGGRRLADRVRRAGRGPAVQRVVGVVMVLTAVAIAANLDVRLQTALATHFPAVVVDPASALERSSAAQRRLADLRGAARFAPRATARSGRVRTTAAPSRLPVLGQAPDFTGTQRWFNTPGGRPLALASLRGKVVLVDFWTYTCINCLRTLPYLRAWSERYRRDGLVIVGVHTPEFQFEHDAGNVAAAVRSNHLPYPVAQDNDYATWNAWGNQSWPADYLIDARGRVRDAHVGEGAYLQTEAAIRSLLHEAGSERLGATADVHAGAAPGLSTTPETYVGSARAEGWVVPPQPGARTYPGPPAGLAANAFALGGRWRVGEESAEAAEPGARIDARVAASSVYLVLSGAGHVEVSLDGHPIGASQAGADVHGAIVTVRRQRLYRLVSLPDAGEHRLGLRFDPQVSRRAGGSAERERERGHPIGWRRMWSSAGPVLSLGVLGTFATAGLLAVAAHVLLGFSWTLAGIIGAALAPTDPAVVFSVLGGTEIRSRAGTILEGEAGVNDPAGIALMIGMIELATHPDAAFTVVIVEFAVEMAVGLALGFVAARSLAPVVSRLRLPSEDLRPVLLIALAVVLYAVTALLHGSGFLAVFVFGLMLGDAELSAKDEIERFNRSLAGVAEIVVFVALGLTVDLGRIELSTWRDGAVLTFVLALVVRPLVVLVALAPAKLERGDRIFIAWSGLKGAVPILLAAFAVLGGVADAREIYGLVFVAVLFSVFGQGSLVPTVARHQLRQVD